MREKIFPSIRCLLHARMTGSSRLRQMRNSVNFLTEKLYRLASGGRASLPTRKEPMYQNISVCGRDLEAGTRIVHFQLCFANCTWTANVHSETSSKCPGTSHVRLSIIEVIDNC